MGWKDEENCELSPCLCLPFNEHLGGWKPGWFLMKNRKCLAQPSFHILNSAFGYFADMSSQLCSHYLTTSGIWEVQSPTNYGLGRTPGLTHGPVEGQSWRVSLLRYITQLAIDRQVDEVLSHGPGSFFVPVAGTLGGGVVIFLQHKDQRIDPTF